MKKEVPFIKIKFNQKTLNKNFFLIIQLINGKIIKLININKN